MTIQQRIRQTARSKIKVTITGRTRSKGGFYVWFPAPRDNELPIGGCVTAKTKREALQLLLAKARCFAELEFSITVRPPHRGDKR